MLTCSGIWRWYDFCKTDLKKSYSNTVQYEFRTTLNKLGIEGKFLNLIKYLSNT